MKRLNTDRIGGSEHHMILTGDRPTGPLHLGHHVGSLRRRVEFQHDYRQFIIIADVAEGLV